MDLRFAFRGYAQAFRQPVRTAHGSWAERKGLYLRVDRPDGTSGLGEAAPLPDFGTETLEEATAYCAALGGRIDAGVLAAVPARLVTVRSALAQALATERPAPRHTSLGVAALLPAGRAALEVGPRKADQGFRVFKWKVGVGHADDEMGMLEDLVGALPGGSRIRLDANGSWNSRTAQRWLDRASGLPIEFVEQPVPHGARGSRDQLMGLAADFPVALALDESIAGDGDVAVWLADGWTGFFVIKPLLLGDLAGTLAALARAGARVVFSSSLETAVGARAALGHAFAWPGTSHALGFGVWPLFGDARFDGPAAAPFMLAADVERLDPEVPWNALN